MGLLKAPFAFGLAPALCSAAAIECWQPKFVWIFLSRRFFSPRTHRECVAFFI